MKTALRLLFALIVLLALLFAGGVAVGWERVWRMTSGPADMGPVSFDGLSKSGRPNQFLICPQGLCNADDVDLTSPEYSLNVDDLRARLLKSLEQEPDLVRVDNASDPARLRFVQRSKWFRFPDTIRIRLIPLEDNHSTLALYSQSQIGRKDFDVNAARAKRWLGRLEQFEK